MAWTHIVVSATATSVILGTTNPAIIAVGAIAGLLPDIDVSTSISGRVFPWVANYLERRFSHRSCTHSLVASGVVTAFAYGTVFLLRGKFSVTAAAVTIGYFFGWFLDCFSKAGVEMFWPSTERYVCPGNRNFRLKTGSSIEYGLLVFFVGIAILSFNINFNGGMLTQFNRLLAAPSGAEEVYNKSGSTHLVMAHIKGVRSGDRSPIDGNFLIVQAQGQDFIVQSADNRIYKAGLDSSSQIIIESITADVNRLAITNIESVTLDDDHFALLLEKYNRTGTIVFLSGQVTIDDAEGAKYTPDPYQFPFIKLSASSLSLEAAPLSIVLSYFSDQYATGQLQVRIINEALASSST